MSEGAPPPLARAAESTTGERDSGCDRFEIARYGSIVGVTKQRFVHLGPDSAELSERATDRATGVMTLATFPGVDEMVRLRIPEVRAFWAPSDQIVRTPRIAHACTALKLGEKRGPPLASSLLNATEQRSPCDQISPRSPNHAFESPMPLTKRSLLAIVVTVALVAAGLLLLIVFVPGIREEAKHLAGKLPLGKAGIVLAGLLALIAYLFKGIGGWFGGIFGGGEREKQIAMRTDAIEGELRGIREEVAALHGERRRALDEEHQKLAAIDQRLTQLRQSREEIDREIERLQKNPPVSTQSEEEIFEELRRQNGYIDLRAVDSAQGGNRE